MKPSFLAALKYGFSYCFSYTLGRMAYDTSYFRGRHFVPYGIGWGWVVKCFFWQKIAGFNKNAPWPVSPRVTVGSWKNIVFDPDDMQIFHTHGTYFQAFGAELNIGKGAHIASNVGLITMNHDISDPNQHVAGENIVIGRNCWIGMNAVILPGVVLGDHTVVGAGAVVTRSFPEGKCVLGGVPARKIKEIDVVPDVISAGVAAGLN